MADTVNENTLLTDFEPVMVRWLQQEIEYAMIGTRSEAAKIFSHRTGEHYSARDVNTWLDGSVKIPRELIIHLALRRVDRVETERDTGWKKMA